MVAWQFVFFTVGGFGTIITVAILFIGAWIKKESTEPKKNCVEKFSDHSGKIIAMKIETDAREKRVMKLEFNYEHILEEIKTIKSDIKEMRTASEKNVIMTEKIYAWMDKHKTNGKRKK